MDVGARQEFWETMRADAADGSHDRLRDPLPRRGRRVRRADGADEARGRIVEDGPTADVRAAYGGRTLTFRPPRRRGRRRRHRPGLARPACVRRSSPSASPTSRSPAPAWRPPSSPSPRTSHEPRPRSPRDEHRPRTTDPAPSTPRTALRADLRSRMATYAALDLRRQLRDRIGMFFIVGLPAFMYLVFGLGDDERGRQRQRRDVRDDLDGGVRRRHRHHEHRRQRRRPSRRWAGAASWR